MNRILEIQLNADYFAAGVLAIRSFIHHNPAYSVVVRDFGLTSIQRTYLEQIATLIPSAPFLSKPGAPYLLAKLDALKSLVPDSGITLFLDADTVTNQSIAPWEEALLQSHASLSFVREEAAYPLCAQVSPTAMAIFPGLARYVMAPGYNWGVILAHRASECVETLKCLAITYQQLLETKKELASCFEFLEQTFGNCFLFENRVPILETDPRHNLLVRRGDCSARAGLFFYKNDPAFIVHFIGQLFRDGERATPDDSSVFGLYRLLRNQYVPTRPEENPGPSAIHLSKR